MIRKTIDRFLRRKSDGGVFSLGQPPALPPGNSAYWIQHDRALQYSQPGAAAILVAALNWISEQVPAPLELWNDKTKSAAANHPALAIWRNSRSDLIRSITTDLIYPGVCLLELAEGDNGLYLRYHPPGAFSKQVDILRRKINIRINYGKQPDPENLLYLRYQVARDGVDGVGPIRGQVLEELELDAAAVRGAIRAMRKPDLGLAVTPEPGQSFTADQQTELEQLLAEYMDMPDSQKPLIGQEAMRIQQLTSNANRADFSGIRRAPQTMVLAALGVSAVVLQIEAGVDASRTGSPYHQQRLESYNRAPRHIQRIVARQLTEFLLPMYGEDTSIWRLRFDNSDNPIMLEEQTRLAREQEAETAARWSRILAVPPEIISNEDKRKLLGIDELLGVI